MEKKIKDPENYIYKRLKKLSKVNIFKSKKKYLVSYLQTIKR